MDQIIKPQLNFRKCFDMNNNENIIYWNLWNTTKTVVRGKFIAENAYFFKKLQINSLTLYHKNLEIEGPWRKKI